MTAQMRTGPAARDPDFRGIDPPALAQVIKQLRDAQAAISGWLNGHRPPAGVSQAGYRQADQVAHWVSGQLGMLERRYNFAVSHPDPGGGVDAPPVPRPAPAPKRTGGTPGGTPRPVRPPGRTSPVHKVAPTPHGAGDLGGYPDRPAAQKAARADALAVAAAVRGGKAVPDAVWKRLKADAGDPDYTETLYARLGPEGAAGLVGAAHGDAARLKVIQESLGTSSRHLTIDVKWLRAFLAEADRAGVRPSAVRVVTEADLSARTREAVARLHLDGTVHAEAAPPDGQAAPHHPAGTQQHPTSTPQHPTSIPKSTPSTVA
ncbi:hypothetical protein [Actinomadura verrucosospora]|uniref:Uncharacterized protein n=1 Tax=Actinomadura verrucosospora TaxID=46165 RepID=A0A7D4ABV0_ACTVE|nr:hypothetical protein [Actinomadura verrucosospora]QKG26527.1 hypothetical protein ACTIVE_8180 [Actinomadura verrucosospora]